MATLPTTRPNATSGAISRPDLTPITSLGSANELGDSSDATYIFDTHNSTGSYGYRVDLGDMPSDFASMLTLTITARYDHPSTLSGNLIVWHLARIMNTAQTTVFAAADSGGTGTQSHIWNLAAPGIQQSGPIAFAYVNTAQDKTAWDAAYLEGEYAMSRSKGGDSQEFRTNELWLAGTYTPTAPTSPRETRTFRKVLQGVNRGATYIVGPSGVLVPARRIMVPTRG